jgi:hypothetical protein
MFIPQLREYQIGKPESPDLPFLLAKARTARARKTCPIEQGISAVISPIPMLIDCSMPGRVVRAGLSPGYQAAWYGPVASRTTGWLIMWLSRGIRVLLLVRSGRRRAGLCQR